MSMLFQGRLELLRRHFLMTNLIFIGVAIISREYEPGFLYCSHWFYSSLADDDEFFYLYGILCCMVLDFLV